MKKYKVKTNNITVGDFTYGDNHIEIKESGEGASLNIGKFCSIAYKPIIFLGAGHRPDWISTYPFGHIHTDELGNPNVPGHPHTHGDVNIGNDVWIAANVTIMSGITIGDGAVIASNSHVIKDVKPYTIVGGNPAQFIKKRFDDEIIEKLLILKWWDLPTEVIRKINVKLCSQPTLEMIEQLIKLYR